MGTSSTKLCIGGGLQPKSKFLKSKTLAEQADSMQMVANRIYMGSEIVSKDKEKLKKHKVTHILAIGWNLETSYPNDFKYLLMNNIEDRPEFNIIQTFKPCFEFMDDCLIKNKTNNILVHCHKGLSRSASIIIAYIMYKNKKKFKTVLQEIREKRSFIMPNIGFQIQLQAFEDKNYSLDPKDYENIDIMERISKKIPELINKIKKCEILYSELNGDLVSDQLFEITMYFHQIHLLYIDGKLNKHDENLLQQAIKILRHIQTQYIKIPESLTRFDKMFTLTSQQQSRLYRRKSKQQQQQDVQGQQEKQPLATSIA